MTTAIEPRYSTIRALGGMLLGLGVLVLAPAVSLAHHSFAMFDTKQSITLRGVVKEFRWNNPHVFIQLIARADAGVAQGEWSIEMTSPEHLARLGWRPGTLKAGDRITLVIHPIRDGSKGGQFVRGTAADGTSIGRTPPARAPESK